MVNKNKEHMNNKYTNGEIGTDLCIQSKIKLTQFQRGSVRGISRKRNSRTEQAEISPNRVRVLRKSRLGFLQE